MLTARSKRELTRALYEVEQFLKSYPNDPSVVGPRQLKDQIESGLMRECPMPQAYRVPNRFIGIAVALAAVLLVALGIWRFVAQGRRLLKAEDFECFGGTIAESADDGVTLRRTKSRIDAGCNYMPKGRRIPLDATRNRFLLHPSRRQNGASCWVTLTFEADPGKFVVEHDWIPDNGQGCLELSELVLPDVRKWAADHNITDAKYYFIKIRVQPWDREGPAITFRRILAGPVPTK